MHTTASAAALRDYAGLPGPRGLPVVGSLLQIKPALFHQQLEQWAAEFGAFYKLQLGRRRVIVLGDHEVVAQVLRDRPAGFRRTSRLEEIWTEMGLPIGVFGANGEVWARQRRMVMAGFDPATVRRYFPAMQNVTQRLVERWQKAAMSNSAIDLQADLMRYTVDTIAGLAFGDPVNTLASEADVIQNHLDKIFPALFKRILSPLPVWRWRSSAADKALAASIVEVNAAVAGFIAKARARMVADPGLRSQPGNLLEAMLAAADEPGSGVDDAQVAGNVLTMLLAGEDTTANTLAWMIDLLWRHPAALAMARDEVRRVVGRDTPTQAHMASLDYVEACIHETMRLKPVAPLLPLQAVRATTLGDVQVAAGQVVLCLLRRNSVSDEYLERAAAFEPERWLGQNAQSPKRIAMPFGAGPRICPGRYLALLEMKLAISALLIHFDITAVDAPGDGGAAENLAFTMTPIGLSMTLKTAHV